MTPEEQARALVARWEHGDAVHRQWLRDVAVPDLIAALTPGPDVVAERAVIEATLLYAAYPLSENWGDMVRHAQHLIRLRARSET